MPSIEEYKKLVFETNFKEIEIWEENSDRFFENQEEMIRWIDSALNSAIFKIS